MPGHLPKKCENIYIHTKTCIKNVYQNFIHNHQKPKTTQISIIQLKDKYIVVYPCNRILSNKWEPTTDRCNTMAEYQIIKPSERRQTQGYIPYDSMCITFWKMQNHRDKTNQWLFLQKSLKEIWGMIKIFQILIVVVLM